MRGISLALALAGTLIASMGGRSIESDYRVPAHSQSAKPRKQSGPVTDTTPESKRAKRRRLAKENK